MISDCSLSLKWYHLSSSSLPSNLSYMIQVNNPPNYTLTENTTQTYYTIKFSTININPCLSDCEVEMFVYPVTSVSKFGNPSKILKKILQNEQYCSSGMTPSSSILLILKTQNNGSSNLGINIIYYSIIIGSMIQWLV